MENVKMRNSYGKKNILLLLILEIIGSIVVGAKVQKSSRIINGELATPGEFKHAVVILKDRSATCGGTIIGERHVLTAAHCVIGNNGRLAIVSGVIDIMDPNGYEHEISGVILHPEYLLGGNDSITENDIALIALRDAITFCGNLGKVRVPNFQVEPGDEGIMAGWGSTDNFDGPMSAGLYKMPVSFTNEESEENYWCNLSWNLLCGRSSNSSSCSGDSGSGVVVDGYVVGILSASYCNSSGSMTLVNVYSYQYWIENAMRDTT